MSFDSVEKFSSVNTPGGDTHFHGWGENDSKLDAPNPVDRFTTTTQIGISDDAVPGGGSLHIHDNPYSDAEGTNDFSFKG
jgi:hypothetical protein